MMKMHRPAVWVVLFALLALVTAPLMGCTEDNWDVAEKDLGGLERIDDDDGDDDSSMDDDSAPADDDDDDTTGDDDDTAPSDIETVEIDPPAQMIPAGTEYTFTAIATTADNDEIEEGFTWAIGDDAVATQAEGVVTGVANGETTLTAELGDVTGEAQILVGPDAYVIDNLTGFLMAVDRGSETAVDDFLAKSAFGEVLNDIFFYEGYLLLTDSGDLDTGISGDEALHVVDIANMSVESYTLDMDNPWAATAWNGKAFVTGNLDDQLAVVELFGDDAGDITYADLDADCAPADIVLLRNRLYITCTGFDLGGMTYGDGKVLVINPSTLETITTIDLDQVNPTNLAATADNSKLYVVSTGDYDTETGLVSEIDPSDNTVVDTIDVGTAPGPIAINETGYAFIGEGMAGDIYVLNTNTNALADDPITISGAVWIQALGVHPDTGNVYACDQLNGKIAVRSGSDPYGPVFQVNLDNPGGIAYW
jgi:Bacterial Ig-like domain (group 2)